MVSWPERSRYARRLRCSGSNISWVFRKVVRTSSLRRSAASTRALSASAAAPWLKSSPLHGVSDSGNAALLVEPGLRALGLEHVEDARQGVDLLVVEIEFVRHVAKGPTDPKAGRLICGTTRRLPLPPPATSSAGRRPRFVAAIFLRSLPSMIETWMHYCTPNDPGLFAPEWVYRAGNPPRPSYQRT